MTPDEYVEAIQQMAQKRAYSEMLELAQTVGVAIEERLTADHVRAIEPFLEHAAIVLAGQRTRSEVRPRSS